VCVNILVRPLTFELQLVVNQCVRASLTLFDCNLVLFVNVFACIVGWRLVEAHFFWHFFRVSYATPALTENPDTILLSVGFT